jgi:hypothetical protein
MLEHLVFGGLAIMVTCVTVDPLALRPRLSPGLPLSNDKVVTDWRRPTKRAWEMPGSPRATSLRFSVSAAWQSWSLA